MLQDKTRSLETQWSKNILLLLFSISGLLIVSQNFLLIPISSQLQETFQIQSNKVYLGTSIFSLGYAFGFLI